MRERVQGKASEGLGYDKHAGLYRHIWHLLPEAPQEQKEAEGSLPGDAAYQVGRGPFLSPAPSLPRSPGRLFTGPFGMNPR